MWLFHDVNPGVTEDVLIRGRYFFMVHLCEVCACMCVKKKKSMNMILVVAEKCNGMNYIKQERNALHRSTW